MKTKAGPVTADERRLGVLQDKDRAKLDRIGVKAAALIGMRAQRAAFAALRRGDNPGAAAMRELHLATPLIVDTMVAGHLAGMRRSVISAGTTDTLRLRSGYEEAIAFLTGRLNVDEGTLNRLGSTYGPVAGQVIATASHSVDQKIQERLQEEIARGSHVRAGKKALSEAFEAAGITPQNSFTLEAIFRTQTQLAYGAGRWNADQLPEIQEILWGYKYITVGDDRVRPEHEALDGVTLPKNSSQWMTIWPPNGWACRCSVISITRPRKIVHPVPVEIGGKIVHPIPDDGFAFNPGILFSAV